MCQTARQARLDAEAGNLFSNREALTAQCEAITGFDRPPALYRACFSLERGDIVPYWIAYADKERFVDPLYIAALPYAREDIAEIEQALAGQPGI